jgi:hypothetical protein
MTTNNIAVGNLATSMFNAGLPITSSGVLVNGNLNVNGNINVSTLVSASIIYESGSTIFGNTSDDFHRFTGSIYMSGSIIDPSSITFNSASVPTILRNYTLAANTTDKTLDLRMGNNATLQIGQEMYYPPIVNKSGVDLVEGTLVMINPAGIAQGQRLSVVKSINNGTYPVDYMVGILTEAVAHNAEGFATWFGNVRGATTTALENAGVKDPTETWLEGDILYASHTLQGGLTKIEPPAPYWRGTVAAITAKNGINLTLLVRPNLRGTLSTLNDVQLSTLPTGSLLYSSGSVWKNTDNIKIQNGYVVLSQVSASYNYANDSAAASAGVPLGGLYHTSGSIKIRLV